MQIKIDERIELERKKEIELSKNMLGITGKEETDKEK